MFDRPIYPVSEGLDPLSDANFHLSQVGAIGKGADNLAESMVVLSNLRQPLRKQSRGASGFLLMSIKVHSLTIDGGRQPLQTGHHAPDERSDAHDQCRYSGNEPFDEDPGWFAHCRQAHETSSNFPRAARLNQWRLGGLD